MVESYLPIGTKVYGIHEHYVEKSPIGGKIIPCKIVSYENVDGRIEPIYRKIGAKVEPSIVTHRFYIDLDEAIKVLSRKTKKNENTNI